MLKLFNSLGKTLEVFRPVNRRRVGVFTCGPSVYQRAHIGNFRTFLVEDLLVRYLQSLGHPVKRGMNFTDIEDKAIQEAEKRKIHLRELTRKNTTEFLEEMKLLKMRIPDYLPRASETVDEAANIIEQLLALKFAYRYGKNVYFDPRKFPHFGEIYGLDLSRWPSKKVRFHKDTYEGMRWNLGDFILWHGCKEGDKVCWDTRNGKGRPAWNIQDAAMVSKYFNETLSIYCGGIDNLFRHHDYSRAILESIRPYPMARYWLHCHHLHVNGQKMSKRKGNVYYTGDLISQGYRPGEVRFFLLYGHYRERLDYSTEKLKETVEKLRRFKHRVRRIQTRGLPNGAGEGGVAKEIKKRFSEAMDDDLNVKRAFDGLSDLLMEGEVPSLRGPEASGMIRALKDVDEVLQVLFD